MTVKELITTLQALGPALQDLPVVIVSETPQSVIRVDYEGETFSSGPTKVVVYTT